MKKDIAVYLEDIVESIIHIEKYIQGASLETFKTDDYMQDAVIRRFQIIGEATKHIPEEIRKEHSEIPWKYATGMRDILIHDYDDVNLERLWKTCKEDLPDFKRQIGELLQKIDSQN